MARSGASCRAPVSCRCPIGFGDGNLWCREVGRFSSRFPQPIEDYDGAALRVVVPTRVSQRLVIAPQPKLIRTPVSKGRSPDWRKIAWLLKKSDPEKCLEIFCA